MESIFVGGPRQTGISSILYRLQQEAKTLLYFYDLGIRQSANEDPKFLIDNATLPVLIDEPHLAPPIFFELKRRIDKSRRERLLTNSSLQPGSYRLTGSNQRLIDLVVKKTSLDE